MQSVIVTGSNGGIGQAICSKLLAEGYNVLGIDKCDPEGQELNNFIYCDLCLLARDNDYRERFKENLIERLKNHTLIGLINNAAIQLLSNLDELEVDDFITSIDVNTIAPLILTKLTCEYLKESHGTVVNIGSVHSQLTKPGFLSYATSKGGLSALTKSLSVDSGSKIRFCAVNPAAIGTDMLIAGFKDSPELLKMLEQYHPSNTIGTTEELANIVLFLINFKGSFINGATIDLAGGIQSRLHDPK